MLLRPSPLPLGELQGTSLLRPGLRLLARHSVVAAARGPYNAPPSRGPSTRGPPGGGRGGGRGGGPPPGRSPPSDPFGIFKGLVLKTEPKTLDSSNRAANPGAGKAGKSIRVQTNLSKLDVSQAQTTHQYSVDVSAVPAGAAAAASESEAAAGQDPASEPKPKGGASKGGSKGKAGPRSRKASREDAYDALQALARGGGWGDEYVYDGAAQLFSVRDDLPAEEEVVVGKGTAQQLYKVRLTKVGTSVNPDTDINTFLRSRGAPDGLAALAPARALLEMVTKAQAAAEADSSVRTPTGYLSYKTPVPGALSIGQRMLNILSGFSSSVKLTRTGKSNGLFLAVDHKVGAVLEDGPLMDVLKKVLRYNSNADLAKLRTKTEQNKVDVDNFQVKLAHTGAKTRLAGFSDKNAKTLTFKLEEGGSTRQVSVQQYLDEKYGVKLKHPDLPCVVAKNGAAFPMELCTVVKAQRCMDLRSARDKAELIRALGKHTVALTPQQRLQKIKAAMSARGPLGALQGAVAQAFGLRPTAADPVTVPARLISGPTLEYKGGRSVDTKDTGSWFPPRDGPIKTPGKWSSGTTLVLLDKRKAKQGAETLLAALDKELSKAGCPRPRAASTFYGELDSLADVEGCMQQAVDDAKETCGADPDLLLVVLPERDGEEVRAEIKRVGHSVLGVATQCLDPVKAGVVGRAPEARKLEQYCGNVALKLNTKLGGTTAELAGSSSDWAPYLGGKHFMVMGADVSRSVTATKGTRTAVTYAGIVATQDRNAVRLSEPKMLVQVGKNDDLIYGMQDAAEDLVRSYATANRGSLPEVIIVYRDGVSESFYDEVLATEFTAIKQACASIQPGYNPQLTYVIVSKSHGMRLFPMDKDAAETRSGNVKPGTVVDEAMTDAFAFEFMLNSHQGIIGTNRVPKYTVLVDEFGFTSDSMQIFTHWLCHTYSLCHRSVSVPPVVKYADKVAEEARPVGGKVADKMVSAAVSKQLVKDWEVLVPLAMNGPQTMSFV